MNVRRGIITAAIALLALVGGCAAGIHAGHGISARSATDGGTPPIMQATVPVAILLLIGLLIAHKFGSE